MRAYLIELRCLWAKKPEVDCLDIKRRNRMIKKVMKGRIGWS